MNRTRITLAVAALLATAGYGRSAKADPELAELGNVCTAEIPQTKVRGHEANLLDEPVDPTDPVLEDDAPIERAHHIHRALVCLDTAGTPDDPSDDVLCDDDARVEKKHHHIIYVTVSEGSDVGVALSDGGNHVWTVWDLGKHGDHEPKILVLGEESGSYGCLGVLISRIRAELEAAIAALHNHIHGEIAV